MLGESHVGLIFLSVPSLGCLLSFCSCPAPDSLMGEQPPVSRAGPGSRIGRCSLEGKVLPAAVYT